MKVTVKNNDIFKRKGDYMDQIKLAGLFYHIRDNKESDLFKGLETILETKDSWWCYRCASMCMKDTRIEPAQRPEYTIKFAKVVFENLEYDLIQRFRKKVIKKPAYQEFIHSEYASNYYEKAYEKHLKELEEARIREEQRKPKPYYYVIKYTDAQKYSHLVYSAKSLEEKSMIVAKERVPYFSYKFIKEVLKTTKMPQEVKKALVMPHAEFVFTSGDKEVIEKLANFLQYKPLYKEYVEEKKKIRVRVPQK